jgi:hypothetical protein
MISSPNGSPVRANRPVGSARAPELDPAIAPASFRANTSEPLAAEEPSAGKLERLAYLCEALGITEDDAKRLRYQLLHRTASALIEAEVFNAPHALMLVHSFSQEHAWLDDYRAFAACLGVEGAPNRVVHVGERQGTELYLGWVTGEARWLEV